MILGYRSLAPVVCGVCGRQAGASGYIRKVPKEGPVNILWACDRHVRYAKRVFDMSGKDLSIYEQAAITRAKEGAVSSLLEAIFSLMWERGIKSLEDVDAETFAGLEKVARSDSAVQASFTKFMAEYVSNLDKVLSGEEAPF